MDNNKRKRRDAILNEYWKQMKVAGYPEHTILKKIKDMGTVFVPDTLPEGFGQGAEWTGGMLSEFRNMPEYKAAKPITQEIPSGVSGVKMTEWGKDIGLTMPSADEYMSYKAGQPTTQLPNYAELMGQTQTTGQFGQARQQNKMNALAEYLANYQGKTLGYDQGVMEAGLGGYPQEYGGWLFQGYKQQQGQEAQIAEQQKQIQSEQKEVTVLMLAHPNAGIEIKDDYTKAVKKAMASEQSESDIQTAKQFLDTYGKIIPTIAVTLKGEEYDAVQVLLESIRAQNPVGTVKSFIRDNKIPISEKQLRGLIMMELGQEEGLKYYSAFAPQSQTSPVKGFYGGIPK